MSRFLNIHHALILGNPPFGEEYGSCAGEVVHQVVIMKSVDQVKRIILSSGIYTNRHEWHTLRIVQKLQIYLAAFWWPRLTS